MFRKAVDTAISTHHVLLTKPKHATSIWSALTIKNTQRHVINKLHFYQSLTLSAKPSNVRILTPAIGMALNAMPRHNSEITIKLSWCYGRCQT